MIHRITRRTSIEQFNKSFYNLFSNRKYNYCKVRLKLQRLEICCAIFNNNKGTTALKILKDIIRNTNRETLQSIPEICSIVKCSLILVQAYVSHLKMKKNLFDFCLPQTFSSAEKCFNGLIYKLIPEYLDVVINTVINFFKDERLWKVEFICCEIFLSLLLCKASPNIIMSKILDYLDEVINENYVKEAHHIVGILHNILYKNFWYNLSLNEINRLIKLYHISVEENNNNQYYQLRQGFEMCLRRFFQIIQNNHLHNVIIVMMKLCFDTNLSEDAKLDFGRTIEYAANCYKTEYITISIEPNIFVYILNIITSNNQNESILGCKILSRLLDRHNNYTEFNTPRIFFDDTIYNIIIAEYIDYEKEFIKEYRKLIVNSLMLAIMKHSHIRVNLEGIYLLISLIVCEVPCGFTTGMLVTLAMKIQYFTLTNKNMSRIQENHLHSTVLSIMTLLCWINRSWSFSNYIKTIVKRRCDEAPNLNPPLKASYQYAQHYVLWNKTELFFDPWELRYGLWKRYRCEEKTIPIHPSKCFSNDKSSYHKSSLLLRSSMDSFF